MLNARWRAFHDADLWKEVPQIKSKEATLNELILKSFEVYGWAFSWESGILWKMLVQRSFRVGLRNGNW